MKQSLLDDLKEMFYTLLELMYLKPKEDPNITKARYYYDLSKDLSMVAYKKGYVPGTWIESDSFPGIKLKVGYGPIWSPWQEALVIGCTDIDGQYYSSVELHRPKDEYWAELVNVK